jgi:cytochrome c oxidase cbb3-type subunit 3
MGQQGRGLPRDETDSAEPEVAGDRTGLRQNPRSSSQVMPGRANRGGQSDAAIITPITMSQESASTPAAPGTPELRPHVFDGIQEYDQRLPNWWLFTFYFTIVWFVLYWFLYYQMGWFRTDHESVTTEIARIQSLKAKELEAMLAKMDDNVLWEWSRNSQITDEGKGIYDRLCFSCHAPDLRGSLAGANFTGLPLHDREWKYGNTPMSLFRMVSKGTPDKTAPVQMPPWEQVLGPSDTAKVVAFVMSHHDQKDPGAVTGPGTYMDRAAAPAPAPAPLPTN